MSEKRRIKNKAGGSPAEASISGPSEASGIGVYAESSLHASLKLVLAEPGDRFEAKVRGKVADILKPTGDIIEIQTQAFAKLKPKIVAFAPIHRVRIAYPIAIERVIVKLDPKTGNPLSVRRSPKRGEIHDIFKELVHYPDILEVPGLSIEMLFVKLEEIRIEDGRGSWRRRGTSIHDRRLVEVLDRKILKSPRDLLSLFHEPIPEEFTSGDLGKIMGLKTRLGGMAAYVLSHAGVSEPIGKRGRSILYRLKDRPRRKRPAKARPLASKNEKAL